MRSPLPRSARRLAATAIIAIATALGACTEALPPTPLASLRISPTTDSFYVGQTRTTPFQVTLLDAAGTEIRDGRKITYSSSRPDVFTVDANTGALTGVAAASGLYRATVDGKFIEANVRIIHPVDRIQLITQSQTLQVGAQLQLQFNVLATGGTPISGRQVNFSSSNPAVVTVNGTGLVSTVAVGQATVTLTSEGKTAQLTITVEQQPVASIRLTPAIPQLLRVGGSLQVTAQPLNGQGQPLSGRTVNWVSSNPVVASVNNAGVVTALATGTTTVTAEADGRTANLGITVTEVPPRSVVLTPDAFDLGTGVTRQIIPEVIDSLGRQVTSLANRNVVWQSTNSAVASVSTSGVVAGVSSGTARIRVTIDGVQSNDVTVSVSQLVNSIRITPSVQQTLRVGGTLQVTATPLDNNNQPVQGKTINWTSTNPAAATVSANGLVTATATGNTSIIAEADGRTATLSVTVTLVPVGSVTLVPSTDTLVVNDTRQYIPVVRDTANRVINSLAGRNVAWSSSNVLNASVNAQGVVTGLARGATTLSVTIDGKSSNDVDLTIADVASVTISPSPATVKVGNTIQLTVTPKDAAGNVLRWSRPLTTFTSNNSAVATVSSSGVVSGLSTGGPVTVTLGINGVNATVAVSVVP